MGDTLGLVEGLAEGMVVGLADGDKVGDTLGLKVGLAGLAEGDEVGDRLGLEEGLPEGERVGLCVGDATNSADSIDTSMSNEETASASNSSLFTTALTSSVTPDSSDEISYSTVSSYPRSLRLLRELDEPRTANI